MAGNDWSPTDAQLRAFERGQLAAPERAAVAEWLARAPGATDRLRRVVADGLADSAPIVLGPPDAGDGAAADQGVFAARRVGALLGAVGDGERTPTPWPREYSTLNEVPSAIREYRIVRELGRGGMGQVYLAEQTSLKRKVAIKMLRPELAANRTSLQRFRAEAEAVAKLTHANIVQIYSVGDQDGVHYMALEYVEGRNLRDYLARKGPPELSVCLSLMRQIVSALQRAHESGFIHRDIKPENILLTRKGEAKVTDFGLSRCFADATPSTHLTQSGVAMGTPLYMSPEQVQGKNADPRSDIYSFGVTCYHMLSGGPPFRGASAFDVAVQHVQSEATPLSELRPDLPPDLCAMVHKMMAKNPDDRYQSFKDVQRDLNKLRDALAGGNGLAPVVLPASSVVSGQSATLADGMDNAPTLPWQPKGKWFPRIVVAAAVLGLLAGGATMRLIRHRAQAKEPTPEIVVEKPQPIISEQERFLLDATKQYADPETNETQKLKRGLDFQIDLFVYYVTHQRFDDAEAFCKELQNRKYKSMPKEVRYSHPYPAFAELGLVLVSALRDQPQAVDQMAKLVVQVMPPRPINNNQGVYQIAGIPAAFLEHPELRRLMAEALNRMALDQKDRFKQHSQLDDLRKHLSSQRTFFKGKT
jgi:serine/threonine-protein kinase